MKTVLLLGGTGEARRLATVLALEPGLRLVTSLAGRVADPVLPPGEVRIGGFGGPAGLAAWLRAERAVAVVDATHPFAARITTSAAVAAAELQLPFLVLRRPGWTAAAGDRWHRVADLRAAADTVARLAERVFLTTGRQGLAAFAHLTRQWFLVRCVDPPEPPTPPRMVVLLDRGPFTVDGELAVLRRYHIEIVVTKDSGGSMTAAKLAAARQLGLPVVMVDRPATNPGTAATVSTVDEAVRWLVHQLG